MAQSGIPGLQAGEDVKIQVSDQVVRHAAHVAAQTQRRIEEVLADWLERVIMAIPVEELSDAEVLALTELQMTAAQQTLLSDLLVRNREGALDTEGRHQLATLMHIYEYGLLRKAQALRVAVQRGLLTPLES